MHLDGLKHGVVFLVQWTKSLVVLAGRTAWHMLRKGTNVNIYRKSRVVRWSRITLLISAVLIGLVGPRLSVSAQGPAGTQNNQLPAAVLA